MHLLLVMLFGSSLPLWIIAGYILRDWCCSFIHTNIIVVMLNILQIVLQRANSTMPSLLSFLFSRKITVPFLLKWKMHETLHCNFLQ
ncbi:hypothetical protein OsI_14859 [Oryza sativa Indica Group]|uniref:Uncharacterized protein n=1 Tax=Oryza sativa subsp. indica TaxID=39946 RepID=B8AVA4_ORYSI|nr:hypothetical protein OsI_14859 [Oryza sativa Indica Group]